MLPKDYIREVLDCHFNGTPFTDQYGTVHDSASAGDVLQNWFDIPAQFMAMALQAEQEKLLARLKPKQLSELEKIEVRLGKLEEIVSVQSKLILEMQGFDTADSSLRRMTFDVIEGGNGKGNE